MKKVEALILRHIEVNCKENSIVKKIFNGSKYAGYDFFIDPELNQRKIISKISEMLKEERQPIHSIIDRGNVLKEKEAQYDMERIEMTIRNNKI